MCLGIPMRIMAISGATARCARRGVERDVDLFLLQDQAVAVGDYVLVHVGYAIQRIDTQEAQAVLDLFDRMEGAGRA